MDETNILEIMPAGLLYLDEHGEKQFIDFAECYERYLAKWSDPDYIKGFKALNSFRSDEELQASLARQRAFKAIGARDYFTGYMEFYTDPPTSFWFADRENIRRVQLALWEGDEWVTNDRG